MDTTLTVRLDTQLKDEAERTLDSLGLSMSSAIRTPRAPPAAMNASTYTVRSSRAPQKASTKPAGIAIRHPIKGSG